MALSSIADLKCGDCGRQRKHRTALQFHNERDGGRVSAQEGHQKEMPLSSETATGDRAKTA
jgi:hypothetical protein